MPHAVDLLPLDTLDRSGPVDFTSAPPAVAGGLRFWRIVLAMAVRDGAVALHYHPWRGDGSLSYVIEWTRYELVSPGDDAAAEILTAAGVLVRGGGRWAALRPRLGLPPDVTGRVRLLAGGSASDWAGVVWSAGGITGVDWYRVDRPA